MSAVVHGIVQMYLKPGSPAGLGERFEISKPARGLGNLSGMQEPDHGVQFFQAGNTFTADLVQENAARSLWGAMERSPGLQCNGAEPGGDDVVELPRQMRSFMLQG